MIRLALDAGHGMANRGAGKGYDPGAVGGGVTEAAVALQWAETVKFYCPRYGVTPYLIRTGTTDANPVGGRDEQAEAADCTHYLSLHLNAGPAAATGTETFYRDHTDMMFAAKVQRAALLAMGLRDRGLKPEHASQHSRLAIFDFDGPTALLEIGFVTNAKDREKAMKRESRIAFAVAFLESLTGRRAQD